MHHRSHFGSSHLVLLRCVFVLIAILAIFHCVLVCCGVDRGSFVDIPSTQWELMTVRRELVVANAEEKLFYGQLSAAR